MKKLAVLLAVCAFATSAFAHSPVEKTTPQNGSVMAKAPDDIHLSFSGGIRLTRLSMTFEDQPAVRLELGEQSGFERTFTIPSKDMGNGVYRIEWRGLGEDGHAMKGDFTFTVK